MKNNITTFSYLIISSLLILTCHSIEVRVMTPDVPSTLEQFRDKSHIKLSINSANRFIYPDNKNTFILPSLIAASNRVEVVSNIYLYPILMIDQQKGNFQKRYNLLHPVTRQVIKSVQQPIVLTPIQKINYFDAQGGFSIKSVLFSGYGMMIIFGVFMYFCYQQMMPKLEQAQQAPNA